jgi:ABC-type antimicrobial peptide transport system permease subunit
VLKSNSEPAEIVGIVGHVKQWGLDVDDTNALRAEFYFAGMQTPDANTRALLGVNTVVRSDGAAPGMFDAIRRSARSHPGELIYGAGTMDSIVSRTLAERSFSMILLASFAALSVILASVGIYGVISYLVGQRTHEIGIRMAMGAQRGDVLKLVLGQAGRMAVIGIVLGVAAALGLTQLLSRLLFGVRPTDPLTFAATALLLLGIALLACYVPARRAARIDPMIALRYE